MTSLQPISTLVRILSFASGQEAVAQTTASCSDAFCCDEPLTYFTCVESFSFLFLFLFTNLILIPCGFAWPASSRRCVPYVSGTRKQSLCELIFFSVCAASFVTLFPSFVKSRCSLLPRERCLVSLVGLFTFAFLVDRAPCVLCVACCFDKLFRHCTVDFVSSTRSAIQGTRLDSAAFFWPQRVQ